MNASDRRLWIDLMTARYLEAVERENFDEQTKLWDAAAHDDELEAAFHEIHEALIEADATETKDALEAAVAKHLPSATVVRDPAGPVTFADVADELFRLVPTGLPNEAWRLNDELRNSREPLPRDLGLSHLIAFAEAKFGTAPRDYWRAFRDAALEVRMRARSQSTPDYQLAARRAPKPEEKP